MTRTFGEDSGFGLYRKMHMNSIVAFLMVTHKRLGTTANTCKHDRRQRKRCKTQHASSYALLHRFDDGLMQMIINMTRTQTLHKTCAHGVLKLLGDSAQ